MHLDRIVTSTNGPETSPSSGGSSLIPDAAFTISQEFGSAESALFQRLDRQGYFSRRTAREEKPFDRFINSIFAPDFIHLGKVDVSCSILSAINRKNPLCLINPIFFQLTW